VCGESRLHGVGLPKSTRIGGNEGERGTIKGNVYLNEDDTGLTGINTNQVSGIPSSIPVGGAEVEVLDNGTVIASITTNSDGFFSIEVPVGSYTLRISKEGYQTQEISDVAVEEDGEEITETVYLIPESGSISGTVFVLEENDNLVGAFDNGGAILKNANITVYAGDSTDAADEIITTTTAENGTYKVDIAPGEYTVKSDADGYESSTAYPVNVGPGEYVEEIDFTLTLKTFTVTVNYTEAHVNTLKLDGTPVANGDSVEYNYNDDVSFTVELADGRVFDSWIEDEGSLDDAGVLEPAITDIKENVEITLNTEVETFTLAYNAGDNGSIYGDTWQVVAYGQDGSEVIAVPDTGYEFTGWSDGVDTASRTDTNVTENITVHAQWEEAPTSTTILYEDGYEYVDFVEGFSRNNGSQEKKRDHLYLFAGEHQEKISVAERTYVTDDKIDLTDVTNITITWKNTGANDNRNISALVVSTDKTWGYHRYDKTYRKENTFDKRTDELDVSTINGEYYIRIHARDDSATTGNRWQPSEIYVYKIELLY